MNPDDLLTVLASPECRVLLRELDDGPRSVEELGAVLADVDDSRDETDAATAVHHIHAPKLEAAGLVTVEDDVVVPSIDTGDAQRCSRGYPDTTWQA